MPSKLTQEQFIEKCKKKFGDEYDYSKAVYKGASIPVDIYHPSCGNWFQRTPSHHLTSSRGCRHCTKIIRYNKTRSTTEEFISNARTVHGTKYDYSKSVYIDSSTPVTIICPDHGEFRQCPNSHTSARKGCIPCGRKRTGDALRLTLDQFISNARKIHGTRYDYSESVYIDNITPLTIICPDHGRFLQTPSIHVSMECGCSLCRHKTEGRIKLFLEEHIPYDIIHDERWPKVLGNKRPDFRIKRLKLIIEYDGEGHFHDIEGRSPASKNKRVDTWKSIKIIRYGYSIIRVPYTLMEREDWQEELLPVIKEYPTPTCIMMISGTDVYIEHRDMYDNYRHEKDIDPLLI
jgi:hypothetical protein